VIGVDKRALRRTITTTRNRLIDLLRLDGWSLTPAIGGLICVGTIALFILTWGLTNG